jgi:hypothetical protein
LEKEKGTASREIETLRAALELFRKDAAAFAERAEQVRPRLTEDLAGLRNALLAANTGKTSFETEAKRIPQLYEQLDEARRTVNDLNKQFGNLNLPLATARRDLEPERRVAPGSRGSRWQDKGIGKRRRVRTFLGHGQAQWALWLINSRERHGSYAHPCY